MTDRPVYLMPDQIKSIVGPFEREIKNLKHEVEQLKLGRPSAAAVKDSVVFELEAKITQLKRERAGANGKYIADLLELQEQVKALKDELCAVFNDSD